MELLPHLFEEIVAVILMEDYSIDSTEYASLAF